MKPAYLLAPVRTPLGRRGGRLSSLSAVDLGVAAVKGALQAAELEPGQIGELILGTALQAGLGPNPARQVAWRARIPAAVPAYTVSTACGSGLQAIVNAVRSVRLGEVSRVVAGGADSVSNAPRLSHRPGGSREEDEPHRVDAALADLLACPLGGLSAAEGAESLACQYSIGCGEAEQYTRKCRQRFERACREQRFAPEIVPVAVSGSDGMVRCWNEDERSYEEPPGNVIESGAASQAAAAAPGSWFPAPVDGAAAAVIVGEDDFRQIQRFPACRIVDYATAGVEPALAAVAMVPALKKLLSKAAVSLDEIDLFELNEFSAMQALACAQELRIGLDRMNVSGGAVSLGSPAGCAGARIVVTLAHQMRQRKARYGIAMLGISGGLGMALLLENVNP